MFLKINLFMILAMFGFLADAGQNPLPSKPGNYRLDLDRSKLATIQKNIGLCTDFSLSKKALSASGPVTLGTGPTYAFSTSKDVAPSRLDSDISPEKCVFDEYNSREDVSTSETRLTRVNDELCRSAKTGGEYMVVSHTTMTATFTASEIRLDFHKEGDEPFSCVWNRKP